MAENGVGPSGENGSQTIALLGEIGVANRVDALMDPVQLASRDGTRDHCLRVAEGAKELADRDHAMLLRSQLGESAMRRPGP